MNATKSFVKNLKATIDDGKLFDKLRNNKMATDKSASMEATSQEQSEFAPKTFTVTANEKPEVVDNTIKITTKQSKSGATIYYDPRGNKIPESQAMFLEGSSFSGSPYDSKRDHASNVLRSYRPNGESTTNANEARDKGYDYFVYARYRIGKSLNGTGRHFQTFEDAVACAKYFYQNKGNLRTDNIDIYKGQSQSSSNVLVHIDKDGNGTFTDAAKNSGLKSSLRGSGDTSRDNIVEPRTQQQRILQQLVQL